MVASRAGSRNKKLSLACCVVRKKEVLKEHKDEGVPKQRRRQLEEFPVVNTAVNDYRARRKQCIK